MKSRANTRLGIVLVAFGNEATIDQLLERLASDKKAGDKIILVDNHPDHKTADIAEKHPVVDKVVRSDNIGFGGGCNLGAEQIEDQVDVLFFLNPDTLPKPGALDIIRHPAIEEWAAWMPLLVTPDGKVNTAGNILHISGLSWISHYGEPAENFKQAQDINLLSGACLAIKSDRWRQLGGFSHDYFMYYEDTDLCLRLKLLGYSLGLMPSAHVVHDYSYKKGKYKFFCLERNRQLLIIRTWPLGVILALLPVLIISELGLWAVSIIEHRFWQKVRSSLSLMRLLPAALVARRRNQSQNKLVSRQFLNVLTAEIDTPLLGKIGRSKIQNQKKKTKNKQAKKQIGT